MIRETLPNWAISGNKIVLSIFGKVAENAALIVWIKNKREPPFRMIPFLFISIQQRLSPKLDTETEN
jgi:hypothetical protein